MRNETRVTVRPPRKAHSPTRAVAPRAHTRARKNRGRVPSTINLSPSARGTFPLFRASLDVPRAGRAGKHPGNPSSPFFRLRALSRAFFSRAHFHSASPGSGSETDGERERADGHGGGGDGVVGVSGHSAFFAGCGAVGLCDFWFAPSRPARLGWMDVGF